MWRPASTVPSVSLASSLIYPRYSGSVTLVVSAYLCMYMFACEHVCSMFVCACVRPDLRRYERQSLCMCLFAFILTFTIFFSIEILFVSVFREILRNGGTGSPSLVTVSCLLVSNLSRIVFRCFTLGYSTYSMSWRLVFFYTLFYRKAECSYQPPQIWM